MWRKRLVWLAETIAVWGFLVGVVFLSERISHVGQTPSTVVESLVEYCDSECAETGAGEAWARRQYATILAECKRRGEAFQTGCGYVDPESP